MITSREQALGEGNCARVTERGKEACECMVKRRVCRLPSERHSPLGCIFTKSARLRTETSYKAGPVRRVSQTMKNKEEPSSDLSRGNHPMAADRSLPGCAPMRTTGSTIRSDDAATASLKKSALSLFPESLMEKIVSRSNIDIAWKNVKANRRAPGLDGITLAEFLCWFRPRWETIRQQLLDGTYQPQPVRRVTIDKPDGGKRMLGQYFLVNWQTCLNVCSNKPSSKS